MRILHIIASVDPNAGGPIEYAGIMAQSHVDLGHEVVFVSLDRDDAPYIPGFPHEIITAGPATPRLAAAVRFGAAMKIAVRNVDVAIIHGLWHVATTAGIVALKRENVPWVTFPHGMLDPYFRSVKPVKHWAKQALWLGGQGQALSGSFATLFTCEEERRLARNAFWGHQTYDARVVSFCAADLVANDVEVPEGGDLFRKTVPQLRKRKYLLFLSRIHPKKACDNLIKAFASIGSDFPEYDLVFAGPDQVGWRAELAALADQLGVRARIHWAGMIEGATKVAAFKNAEAFVLPSHQENFGIVVAEALSVGTPVIISDKVNIWREVIEDGAGMVCEDTVEHTTRVLRDYLSLPKANQDEMRTATRPCYEKRFSVESASRDLMEILKAAVAANRSAK